mmetsp:Transcript_2330/g.7183  ORF Transcript_2330/g.7183 Transcript_2330/m.7183 type:complete len:396 (+) Transcript_2330:48-1235(+)
MSNFHPAGLVLGPGDAAKDPHGAKSGVRGVGGAGLVPSVKPPPPPSIKPPPPQQQVSPQQQGAPPPPPAQQAQQAVQPHVDFQVQKRRAQNLAAARRSRQKRKDQLNRVMAENEELLANERKYMELFDSVKRFLYSLGVTSSKFPALRDIESLLLAYGELRSNEEAEREHGKLSGARGKGLRRLRDKVPGMPSLQPGIVESLASKDMDDDLGPKGKFGDIPALSADIMRDIGVYRSAIRDHMPRDSEDLGDDPAVLRDIGGVGTGGLVAHTTLNNMDRNLAAQVGTVGADFQPQAITTLQKMLTQVEQRIMSRLEAALDPTAHHLTQRQVAQQQQQQQQQEQQGHQPQGEPGDGDDQSDQHHHHLHQQLSESQSHDELLDGDSSNAAKRRKTNRM